MANYYHEARAHVRSLKQLETDNKRRGERRAEVANAQASSGCIHTHGRLCGPARCMEGTLDLAPAWGCLHAVEQLPLPPAQAWGTHSPPASTCTLAATDEQPPVNRARALSSIGTLIAPCALHPCHYSPGSFPPLPAPARLSAPHTVHFDPLRSGPSSLSCLAGSAGR